VSLRRCTCSGTVAVGERTVDLLGVRPRSWRPHRRVTVNLGARLDRYRSSCPSRSTPSAASTRRRRPSRPSRSDRVERPRARTGVAYDLSGDGRPSPRELRRYALPGNMTAPTPTRTRTVVARIRGPMSTGAESGRRAKRPLLGSGAAPLSSRSTRARTPVVTEAAHGSSASCWQASACARGRLAQSVAALQRVSANRPFGAFSSRSRSPIRVRTDW